MKKLIDIYKQHPEASEFIKKHLKEFSECSYNDTTKIKPRRFEMNDMTLIITNIHLLKRKRNIELMTDYFDGANKEYLLKKYKIKSQTYLKTLIHYLKKLIKKRFEKMLDEQLQIELKKANPKAQKIADISFNLTKNKAQISLIKVGHKNRINYKFHDEDISMLYRKAMFLKNKLSVLEKKKVEKIFKKQPSPETVSVYYFEELNEIISRYRCVNKNGYYLPKVVDDAIILILTEKYTNNNEQINELFQSFN